MADQSIMSRMGATFLPQLAKRVFPSDWVTADPAERLHIVKRRRSIDGPRPDLALQRKWGRATTEIAGRELHLLTPKEGSTGRVLYYAHGGAFVIGPGALEWLFAAKIAERLGCDLALYDYPKVPEHDSTDIHPANLAAYDPIVERYPNEAPLISGTSAGGALALTTMLQLHRAGRELPRAGLLISPWLDVSVSHDDIASYAESDKLLEIDCLRTDGSLYAGPNDPTDPLVSARYMSDDELAALPWLRSRRWRSPWERKRSSYPRSKTSPAGPTASALASTSMLRHSASTPASSSPHPSQRPRSTQHSPTSVP